MLQKNNKLTREAFPKHTERRSKWVGNFLSIQYIIGRESVGEPLFAVVIPKKTIASAVRRNQLKRIIYDTISDFLPHFSRFKLTKVIITPIKGAQVPNKNMALADLHQFIASV